MKTTLGVCLLALSMATIVKSQDSTKPVLRPGISVQMSRASHAVEMPEADAEDATVVAVTNDGNVFLGLNRVETSALSSVKAGTVYVKVDARAPFQSVLTVLDALHGRPVVLLTAPLARREEGKIMSPYGVKVSMGE